ncbi:hypothetical protein AM593_07202, partial [Mytilus galloprovincialis]
MSSRKSVSFIPGRWIIVNTGPPCVHFPGLYKRPLHSLNSTKCYCRQSDPLPLHISDYKCTDTFECPGNSLKFCGGSNHNVVSSERSRITVSKIDLSTETVTEKNTKATIATSVSIRDSTTADFMNMITNYKYPGTTIPELFSTTSEEDANPAIRTLVTERPSQATTANGKWSLWNDWKFCEVNCIREDTTDGTQRRWRTCEGTQCSGGDMEERSCSELGICKGMRPRKLLCKCPKRLINTKWHFLDGKNKTDKKVRKMVLEDFNKNLKSEISVDKKTVSKEIRKKNSSVNKRKSSQSIGWGCIVFLILPVVFLITIDILNCCINFQSRIGDRKRNRIGPTSNIEDTRDSIKPLQKNVNATENYYASRCGNNVHPDERKRETYPKRRDDNVEKDRDKWLQIEIAITILKEKKPYSVAICFNYSQESKASIQMFSIGLDLRQHNIVPTRYLLGSMSLFYIMCYANIFKIIYTCSLLTCKYSPDGKLATFTSWTTKYWKSGTQYYLYFSECVILYQCYDLDSSWEILIEDKATTNIWCDNKCKAAELNYRFSGTISKYCYCQTAVPKKKGSRTPSNCTEQCPGNHSEICGVSEIGNYTHTLKLKWILLKPRLLEIESYDHHMTR